jgi:hypothetical protein
MRAHSSTVEVHVHDNLKEWYHLPATGSWPDMNTCPCTLSSKTAACGVTACEEQLQSKPFTERQAMPSCARAVLDMEAIQTPLYTLVLRMPQHHLAHLCPHDWDSTP